MVKKLILGMVLVNFVCGAQPSGLRPWTWLHTKRFDAKDFAQTRDKGSISIIHGDTPSFTQAILSFNSALPARGYLSFYIQAKSMYGQWLETHHMLDWGPGVSRTMASEGHQSSCHHVRLEIPRMASGYRIRIQAQQGADISCLRALSVCISDFTKFSEDPSSPSAMPGTSSSVLVDNVRQYSQMTINHARAPHMCSPTSLSMLLSYILGEHVEPLMTAQAVYDTGLDAYGSWPFAVAHAYQFCHKQQTDDWCYWAVTRLSSFADIYGQLSRNIPVLVSVRGSIPGAAKVYPHGHHILVIGYDAKARKVICHDPAFDDASKVRVAYDIKPFLAAWGRSHNLAIVVDPLRT